LVSYNGSIYTVLRKSKRWRGNRSCVQGEFQGAKGQRYRIILQRTLPFCETFVVFRGKAVGKGALKTGSKIITDILNKEPEQPVGYIFKNRFGEAKDNLEEKN
jgi:hypothetical protein